MKKAIGPILCSVLSFDRFLQQRLFQPLAMTDTFFFLPPR
jgi:hypothetical protein